MTPETCPHCQSTTTKAGRNPSGSQRYQCKTCRRHFTPLPNRNGYGPEVRRRAIRAVLQGNSLRGTAALEEVAPESVANWVKAHAARLPEPACPDEVDIAEMDEWFTFVGNKTQRVYLVTLVDRKTRCFLGWDVVKERTTEALQAVLDAGPRAFQYNTDAFSTYTTLHWRGQYHLVAPGKSETYAVEGNNAELRHYVARLARRTRCFAQTLTGLQQLLRLFVYYWNQRQLYHRQYPQYRRSLVSFVPAIP